MVSLQKKYRTQKAQKLRKSGKKTERNLGDITPLSILFFASFA
jgi:hypothetical protein